MRLCEAATPATGQAGSTSGRGAATWRSLSLTLTATSGRSPCARKFDRGERPKVMFAATSLDLSSACPGHFPLFAKADSPPASHRVVPTLAATGGVAAIEGHQVQAGTEVRQALT